MRQKKRERGGKKKKRGSVKETPGPRATVDGKRGSTEREDADARFSWEPETKGFGKMLK